MSNYLNSDVCVSNFSKILKEPNFIDKSLLIEDLVPSIDIENRFICITRPRRFGKTVAANMIASFFGKDDSSSLFGGLKISQKGCYTEHLNKHNVIFIDFSQETKIDDTFESYISRIEDNLKDDLYSAYSFLDVSENLTLVEMLRKCCSETKQGFIFVFDEWDAPFRFRFVSDSDKESYIDFLHVLLKGQFYVELAYMTGILPIKKYSSSSDLNMFTDYSLLTQAKYSLHFGFTEEEVDELYEKNKNREDYVVGFSREDLRYWYDGYETTEGKHLYNPRSVVLAFSNNRLANYWTSSGPSDEIFNLLKLNINDIQKPVAQMMSGERIVCSIDENVINSSNTTSKLYIFSAMVVYGLLTTEDSNKIKIPNYEIMQKFDSVLKENNDLGYINQLAMKSSEILDATLNQDEEAVAQMLEFVHDTETPLFSYNRENELTAVVNLVYLAARDLYFVSREDKAGKGFTDIIFTPKNPADEAIILELKVDSTPEEAISQIRQKNYAQRFMERVGEKSYYTGNILLVGISYDKKEKKHACKIEVLER